MATTHIPEAEAVRDFARLLARVRAGEEIVIEKEASPAVVLCVAAEAQVRRLSESLRLARQHCSEATLDGGFAQDLAEIVDSHPEPLDSRWD